MTAFSRRRAGARGGRQGVPSPSLRLAAPATLAAHLGKLAEEGRLPPGVRLPPWPPPGGLRPVV